jgi:2'-5' RNA ligase
VLRIFVAIDTPEYICRQLAEQIAHLKQSIPPEVIRWVNQRGIHLTLKFLGDVSPGKIDQIVRLLESVGPLYKPFEVEVRGFGCFPNPRRPRVLWVGVYEPSGTLIDMHAYLESGFESMGFKRETRPFHPHLTIGRARRNVERSDINHLSEFLATSEIRSLGRFQVEEIYLIRSELKPTGAVYSKLAAIGLERSS